MFSIFKNVAINKTPSTNIPVYNRSISYQDDEKKGQYIALFSLCSQVFESRENWKRLLKAKIEDLMQEQDLEDEELEELFEEGITFDLEGMQDFIERFTENQLVAEDFIIELIDLYFKKPHDEFRKLIAHLANAFGMELVTFKRIWLFIEAYYEKSQQLAKLAEDVRTDGPHQLLPLYMTEDNAFSYEYIDEYQAIFCNVSEQEILEQLYDLDEDLIDLTLVNCRINIAKEQLVFADAKNVIVSNCQFSMQTSPRERVELSEIDKLKEEYDQFFEDFAIDVSDVEVFQLNNCMFKNITMPILKAETDITIIKNCSFENIQTDATPCFVVESEEVKITNNQFMKIVANYEEAEEDALCVSTLYFPNHLDSLEIIGNHFKNCRVAKRQDGACVVCVTSTDEQVNDNNKVSNCDKQFLVEWGY